MKVKQEGEGNCPKCRGPLMSQIGIGPVCMACEEAAKPKTGKTVVVTGETGDGINGSVTLSEVPHGVDVDVNKNVNPKTDVTPTTNKDVGRLTITVTLEELEGDFSLCTLLDRIYDTIDELPPGGTLKETKRLIAIQDKVKNLRWKKGE